MIEMLFIKIDVWVQWNEDVLAVGFHGDGMSIFGTERIS